MTYMQRAFDSKILVITIYYPALLVYGDWKLPDFVILTSSAKVYNTCIALQATYRNCSGAVLVTDVQPIGHRLTDLQTDLRPTNHTPPGLPFNGLHPHRPCNYMDFYSFTDPKGMEG